MRSIVILGGVLCLLVMLTACTTTRPYNRIDSEARPHIQQMDSVMISKQTGVRAKIKTSKVSQYVQGHFAPVLFDIAVNGIRSHKAGKIMKPIHETLDGYDFTQDIKEEFTTAIGETEMGDMVDLMHMRKEPQGFRAAYIRQSEADAVMFLDVDCAFTPNFDALQLSSRVMIFPVSDALAPYKEKPDKDNILELEDNIYRNGFISSIPVRADVDSSKSENGAAWAEMSEEELTGLMQQAAQELAALIASDLSTDDISEEELKAQAAAAEAAADARIKTAAEAAIKAAAEEKEQDAEPVSKLIIDPIVN